MPLLPVSMTLISFVIFLFLYLIVIRVPIEPFYIRGLLFLVPCLFFAATTILALLGKIQRHTATGISVFLIFFLLLFSFYHLFQMTMDAATTVTTDVGRYERILKEFDYPNNSKVSHFPEQIPDEATDVRLRYNPAFFQGGEFFSLKYEISSRSLEAQVEILSREAKWVGYPGSEEAEALGITSDFLYCWDNTGRTLPSDLEVYLLASRPYKPNDWNHGTHSLAAVSKETSEILFLFEAW